MGAQTTRANGRGGGLHLVEEGDLEPLGSRWLLKVMKMILDGYMDDMDDDDEDAASLVEARGRMLVSKLYRVKFRR
jgi:hypothetical protein